MKYNKQNHNSKDKTSSEKNEDSLVQSGTQDLVAGEDDRPRRDGPGGE